MATFKFTRDEYLAASLSLAKQRTLRFILFLAAVVVAIATFRVIRNDNVLAASPYVVALLVMVPTVIFVLRHRLGKTFDDQASLRETFTVEINSEGIRYSHSTGTRLLGWDRIKKWSEDRRFIFLFESDLHARILPKRALSETENKLVRSQLASVATR
jgi:hypothetical protein